MMGPSTTLVLAVAGLFNLPLLGAGEPPLVGLDPSGENKGKTQIGVPVNEARHRVALMPAQVAPGLDAGLGRRFTKRLSKALNTTGKFLPVLEPTHLRSALPLQLQQKVLNCGRPSCIQELSHHLTLDLAVLLSIRKSGTEHLAVVRVVAGDGTDRFVVREVLPTGKLRPDKAVVLANRIVDALTHPPATSKSKAQVAGSAKQPAKTAVAVGGKPQVWARRVGFGLGLGGIGLIGTGYATMERAQESFDARPISRTSVDELGTAQGTARTLWGAGLAMTGLAAVTLALSR